MIDLQKSKTKVKIYLENILIIFSLEKSLAQMRRNDIILNEKYRHEEFQKIIRR
jgi:hypothetical protein